LKIQPNPKATAGAGEMSGIVSVS